MPSGKRVILYVDDDPDYRLAMRQLLEASGLAMVEASNGEDGLKVFNESSPDLIILDLMMEEVDAGVNLLRELKAVGNEAPVYLMSSVGDSMSMTTDASSMGFAGVFQKPIDNEHLIAVINSRLN